MNMNEPTAYSKVHHYRQGLGHSIVVMVVMIFFLWSCWNAAYRATERMVIIPWHNVAGLNKGTLEYGPDGTLRPTASPDQHYKERLEQYRKNNEAYKSHPQE